MSIIERQGRPGLTNAQALTPFFAAMRAVRTAPIFIDSTGHSIMAGVGTESASTINDNQVADQFGLAGQLRQRFAERFGIVGGGSITPYFEGADSRVATTGSPSSDSTCGVGMKLAGRIRSTDSITFTTPACTAIDILYYAGGPTDGTLNGGFSYQIDGGSIVTGLATGQNASGAYGKVSLAGLSNTTHTVKLVGLHTTNQQHISGIRYHNNAGVVVSRYARSGWTTLDSIGIGETSRNAACVGNQNAQARVMAAYGAFNPHLSILSLIQNDAARQDVIMNGGASFPSLDMYERITRAQVGSMLAQGSAVLLLGTGLPPTAGIPATPGMASYLDFERTARRIALEMGAAHLAISDRWGRSSDGGFSSDLASTLGFFVTANSVHPSRKGYSDMADILFEELMEARHNY